jgi:hypothetical protein
LTTLKYLENGKNYEAGKFLHIKVKPSQYKPGQALRVPKDKAPRAQDNQHKKIVRLSAVRTGRLYPNEILLARIYIRD